MTRGLGQSALSIVSLAMVGKWFRRRLTWAMGVYALAMSIGFMIAFPAVGAVVHASGWRVAWAGIGAGAACGPCAARVAVRALDPESIGAGNGRRRCVRRCGA